MRRGRRIVNEMEFRMWREGKSFSPSADADTMKRFPLMRKILESGVALKRPCPMRAQYEWPFH